MRTPGLAVPSVLAALVVTLLAGAPPAAAVERYLTTSYDCEATHAVLGSLGSGSASVTITADLPRRTDVDARLRPWQIEFDIQVPEEMVDQLREYGVDAVSATSRDASYRLGAKEKPIAELTVPETAVPESGGMTIEGVGTASGHRFERTGRYPVKVPLAFSALATAHGTDGFGEQEFDQDFDIDCALPDEAPQKIAVIRVVR